MLNYGIILTLLRHTKLFKEYKTHLKHWLLSNVEYYSAVFGVCAPLFDCSLVYFISVAVADHALSRSSHTAPLVSRLIC